MHTSSSDGRDDPAAMLREAARRHLQVIAVTDHNAIQGALEAAELAAGTSLPEVVVGEEVSALEGHVLGLFLTELIEPGLSASETVAAIHAQGGLAIAPHPFWHPGTRDRGGIGQLAATLPLDGIEVINGAPVPSMWQANRRARALNRTLGRAQLGGSDAHASDAVGWGQTLFAGRDSQALRDAILSGTTEAGRGRRGLLALLRYGFWGARTDARLLGDILPV